MTRERAIDVLHSLRASLEARGVAHVGIFGSVSRGEADDASDIDIIVTPSTHRRMDLIDLGGVQTLLDEGFVGLAVDVVVAPVAQPNLKEAIDRDCVSVF